MTLPNHTSATFEAPGVSFSIGDIVQSLVRNVRLVVGSAVATGVLLATAVGITRDYRAVAQFRPAASSAVSGLASIAAQLGADIGGLASADVEPLDFWAQVIKSRDLLLTLGDTSFAFPEERASRDSLSGTLYELYEIEEDTPEEERLALVERLRNDVSVKTDLTSGILTLTTQAPFEVLSEQLNRRLLDALNAFNLDVRQSRARAEARFVAERVAAARDSLQTAEDVLRGFLDANRTYQTSPRLVFEEARLQRRVSLFQQVYIGLAQAAEQARIEEVRDTPVITILEEPEGSAEHTVGLAAMLVIGGFLGGAAATMLVLLTMPGMSLGLPMPDSIRRLVRH